MNIDFYNAQVQNLSSRQLFSEDFIMPDYQGLNINNILPQIGAIFGIGSLRCSTIPSDCLAELEGIKKVALIIFDGFGYNRFLQHIKNHDSVFAELAEKGVLKPLTTVFPSTTSTALTSIFTGLPPAQHLVIGYHMFSKKYGLIFNTLDMKPVYGYSGRVELVKDFMHHIKPLFSVFEQNGVKISVITKASIVDSGLSQITHRDIKPIPYLLSSDLWIQSSMVLEQPSPSLTIIYYSGFDTLAHKYGPYSQEATFELTSIEHNLRDFISMLSKQTKEETLLVLTADHGVAEVGHSYFIKDIPDLMRRLMLPPVGDGRATYLFSKPEQKQALSEAFSKKVSGFTLFSSEDLINKGVFGQPINLEELKEKIGDFAAVSNSDGILEYPFFEDDRGRQQLGAHGGMTAEEMIIPLLSTRLSNF